MKQFALQSYGPAQTAFFELSASSKELTAGRIRVKVHAFAINPYDVALRLGGMRAVRTLNFPYVPGNDGAGVITEVAKDVQGFQVGEHVMIHPMGGVYGEEVVLPVKRVCKIPSTMSFATAAALVTPGITAYHLLFSFLSLPPNQTILILGASGSVGSCLVQLLHQSGHQVLTSAKKRNEEWVRQLGATEFVAYDEQDVGCVYENQADVVIDATKGGHGNQAGMQALKENGIFVALNQLPEKAQRLKTGDYLQYIREKTYSDVEALNYLLKKYQENKLQVKIAQVFPFELTSVIAAHQALEGHPQVGRFIIG